MIQIRLDQPMPSRSCAYCLAMQDDSVFADFDIDENSCLYIVRISYDGYGCCVPNKNNKPNTLNSEASKRLIKFIEENDLENVEARDIIVQYFRDNKDCLWEDALRDHQLI